MSGSEQPLLVGGARRALYVLLGTFFLALGLLGVFLPGLPTTPFLLLTSYFFVRSSPWLHDHVLKIPGVGACLRDWREAGGVRAHVKIIAYVMVVIAVGCSLAVQQVGWQVKGAILILATLGIGVVWRLPTARL